MFYINYFFENIRYDEKFYCAKFSCPDLDVQCNFRYNRITGQCEIWNNNKPVEQITPIPVWWLDKKLKENGILHSSESKISY